MEFSEEAVEHLDTTRPDDVIELLSRLCGQDVKLRCESPPRDQERCGGCLNCHNYNLLTTLCRENRWNMSTLNQALLLLNQPTVSSGFYGQFFRTGEGGDGLKRGVVHFRGMAMLGFGNFRFAYKNLCSKGRQDLIRELEPYSIPPEQWKKYYHERPETVPLVGNIDRNKKWLLGYISGPWSEQDILTLTALQFMLGGPEEQARKVVSSLEKGWERLEKRRHQLNGIDPKAWEPKLQQLGQGVAQIRNDGEATRAIGARNTSAYLSSDHLDVYVATSMRESWEYEDASTFLEQVFSHEGVKDLNPSTSTQLCPTARTGLTRASSKASC